MKRLPLYLSVFCFLISIVLFYPAHEAGRVYDFTGFFINMEEAKFFDSFSSFGYHVVQPFLQIFNYSLFKVAGRSSEIYYLVFHLLFALGIYGWAKYLSAISNIATFTILAVLAITINPYVVEVLVYKVSQAYLWTFLFLGWYHFMSWKYLKNGGAGNLLIILILLLGQLWTFDFIIIYLPLSILFYWIDKKSFQKKKWFHLIFLNLFILVIYFLQNKLILGDWVGHYGREVHMHVNIFSQLGTMLKYFCKQVFLGQFFSYPLRTSIYAMAGTLIPVVSLVGISLIALYLYLKPSKFNESTRIALYFFLASLLSLIPVSNLSFMQLMTTENDRYGFLFAFFITVCIVSLLIGLKSKVLKWTLIGLFLLVNVIAQGKLIRIWADNQKVIASSLSDWPSVFYDENAKVYLLNLPDNFKGSYLYKNLSTTSDLFKETYISHRSDTTFAEFSVIAQMNTQNTSDGAKARKISDREYLIELNQYGTWWWRNSVGASSYETPEYSFDLQGLSYKLTMKTEIPHLFIWNEHSWHRVE